MGCYMRGLSQVKEATNVHERTEAVSLISEACAAKIAAACETFEKRSKRPQRITGRFPQFTEEALRLGVHGQISVKCTIVETGAVRGCAVLPQPTEEEQKLLVQSKLERELLAVFETWRFTPMLFDDQPIELPYTFRVKLSIR